MSDSDPSPHTVTAADEREIDLNPFEGIASRVGAGARNAVELLREGRLGGPYRAPFEVQHETDVYKLRRYHPDDARDDHPVVLLVPPLMVASEIYDISPELSAVSFLAARDLDVWVVDYGPPTEREDGLDRTLDDHVLAVDAAVDEVAARTGNDIHLAGYSQGGIFCYQAAAYRRSEGIESVVTFGSPIDIRRNLPVEMHDDLAERLLRAARRGLSGTIDRLEQLPGSLTSSGFKLLNPGKEISHLLSFFGVLHDREELKEHHTKRRFLGGEGFVAWPGDAFRDFVDDVVVGNRMHSGGFVIGDRSVSLSDIEIPILYYYGAHDELARPDAVRAIEDAAPDAWTEPAEVSSGHFGLVVGSTAMGRVWPGVERWVESHSGDRDSFEVPSASGGRSPSADGAPEQGDEGGESRTEALYDVAAELADSVWKGLGDVSLEIGDVVDTLRWQIPRLARLEDLDDETRINVGRALDEQARSIPDETFFLWQGRAFSYAEANRRVDRLAAGLLEAGLDAGDHVGVYMDNHPDVLTAVGAASRIGAVSVLVNAGAAGRSLEHALETGEVDYLITDPAHLEEAAAAVDPEQLAVAREPDPANVPQETRLLEDLFAAEEPAFPEDRERNPGRAEDLALLMFTSGTTGLPKAARITNRRWALAALGTAAGCELTPHDTVYCVLPLYHATGLLVAVGGALIGGSRLALSEEFSTSTFWDEVRRYGATVVFYVGELCRYLVNAPERPEANDHPVRLFVGNGMRPDVWERLLERFGPVDVLEFYGSTEGNVALANFEGEKIGSIGRPIPGTGALELVDFDASTGDPVRRANDRVDPVGTGEPGLLLARISDDHPLARFDGYLDDAETERKIVRDALELGDAWFNTGDVLRRDSDGDYWFVDRVGDTFRWSGENVSTEQVARIVRRASFVGLAVVYGVEVPGREGRAGMAAIVVEDGEAFDGDELFERVDANLFPAAHPRFVRLTDAIETTDSFKYLKRELQEEGANPSQIDDPLYLYDDEASTYRPLEADEWPPASL